MLGTKKEKVNLAALFFSSPLVTMFGKLTWPIAKTGPSGLIPLIRAPRYGLINPTPMSPKNYFRRSSYGQFRDMMEQPPETAYSGLFNKDINFNAVDTTAAEGPVKVRFIARNGTPDVDPLDTNSQNLSQFATSSLPYFDGLNKERDVVSFPPPDDTDKTSIGEAVDAVIDGDA